MSFALTLKTLNREALCGLLIIVLVILLGIIVPIASPNDASGFAADPLAPPSMSLETCASGHLQQRDWISCLLFLEPASQLS